MKFQYNDGGRSAAGFSGKDRGGCVCRAIATATERPYMEVYALIERFASMERTGKRKRRKSDPERGVYPATTRRIMEALGWVWVPTMGIGTGCRVHLRDGELPSGRLLVEVSHHTTAVIDGVLHDTFDPTRDGTRCVYGYFRPGPNAVKKGDPMPLSLEIEHARARVKERRRQVRRHDREGWRIFSPAQMRREVERLIPAALRPYYVGCEVSLQWAGPLTAENSDIYVYFKRPVCGSISDARYAHGSLVDLADELAACCLDDSENGEHEEYDETYGARPVVAIKAPPADRDELRRSWRKGVPHAA